jgi:ribosomal RNA-processing protein 9
VGQNATSVSSALADIVLPFRSIRTISLWNTGKKKPIFSHALAHGLETYHSETEGPLENPRWILSLTTLPYSNIFVSGSWDGSIRFWKIADDIRSFTSIGELPAIGCVNSLQLLQLPKSRKQITSNGAESTAAAKGGAKQAGVMLVAALGQEPKFGRWKSIREAKNVALVVSIPEI